MAACCAGGARQPAKVPALPLGDCSLGLKFPIMQFAICAWRPAPIPFRQGASSRRRIALRAAEDRGPFKGVYGTWTITDNDVAEVLAYRAGLTALAGGAWLVGATQARTGFARLTSCMCLPAGFCAGTLGAVLPPDSQLAEAVQQYGNLLAVGGTAGLAVSLVRATSPASLSQLCHVAHRPLATRGCCGCWAARCL